MARFIGPLSASFATCLPSIPRMLWSAQRALEAPLGSLVKKWEHSEALIVLLIESIFQTSLRPGSRPSASNASSAHAHGISDELLVSRWQEGDRQAFEALVRRYQHVAFTVCQRYLHNPQVAEETAQDVFVALYRKLHEFRGESSFKSWFYRVLTNHCHNRHKAGQRRRESQHDSIDAPDPRDEDKKNVRELADPGQNADQLMEDAQRQALIEKALQSLGEEARMILLLREGQGMAYEDIGAALQLNAGTVKSRLHRARADLKAAVDRMTAGARHSETLREGS